MRASGGLEGYGVVVVAGADSVGTLDSVGTGVVSSTPLPLVLLLLLPQPAPTSISAKAKRTNSEFLSFIIAS